MKRKRLPRKKLALLVGLFVTSLLLGVAAFFIIEQRVAAPEYSAETAAEEPEEPAEEKQPEPPKEPTPTPPQPQPQTPTATPAGSADSIRVVVNKKHPLSPLDYAPADLVGVGGGQYARQTAAAALTSLFNGASAAGNPMHALSGYRSYATQTAVYNNYVRTDGQAVADTYSARPGHSEHQTGLAIDVGNGTCNLQICFGNTAAGKWLAANAHKYGFVIRYPNGKTAITGYQYEPWHLRYVGTDVATDMKAKGVVTLEEYFGVSGGTSY